MNPKCSSTAGDLWAVLCDWTEIRDLSTGYYTPPRSYSETIHRICNAFCL